MGRWAVVAPPLPVAGLFTYEVPPALLGRVQPGTRVLVPFGPRKLRATCVRVDDVPPPAGVLAKPLIALLDEQPLVGADLLQLAEQVASATACSWGEALDALLPPAVKRARAARTIELARTAGPPHAAGPVVEKLQADKRTEKQARALRILADRGGELPVRELQRLAHVSRSPIETLAKNGLILLRATSARHDPLADSPVERTEPLALHAEQRVALSAIEQALASGRPATFLLHGVTGSGKTEVYLQALAGVVAGGRQGIVLVPEISLTPQTVRRFRERFERVAVLHSGLTDAERADQWRAIRAGEADVVVGARSAVFAPVPRLGLIVIDEEHETSFKQNSVPRYHAREVAVARARISGAVLVLGTATPSLEAWHRAQDGAYRLLTLHERLGGGRQPEVVLVDLTTENRRGKGFSFLSDPLRAAMEDALARGGQVLLFLNRRGWAQVLLCRTCKATARCPNCEVSLTLHRRIGRLLCHWCAHERVPPATCATCGGPMAPLGWGTEKVEEDVRQSFLSATVARMDSDTMSGRGAHETALTAFAEGRTDVLIGTQMIAKGLHFPNVLLVGVICADSALFLPDVRAAERTFQLLAQVAGRTARGPRGGRVVVQAFDPRHFAVRLGMSADYERFAATELALRREANFPPFTRIVRVVAHGAAEPAARRRIDRLAAELRALDIDGVQLLGPAPAPLARLNRQYRFHLLARCLHDDAVAALTARLAGQSAPSRGARLLVDVDPVSML